MEGVSANFYRGFRTYWRKKPYQRLDGTVSRRKRVEIAKMGGKKRRLWRIRLNPKLRFKIPSPKKLLIRLRDAYVKMMLSLANSKAFSGGFSAGFAGQDLGYGRPFGNAPLKEYDEKVLVEIYRTLITQGALIPHRSKEVGCRRLEFSGRSY